MDLEEQKNNNKSIIYQESKDKLGQNQELWYKANLLWKTIGDELPTNKVVMLVRLKVLLRKL